ncbi:hypothetical protein BLNAU_3837 [Blattamonas nauphoetae]|uniref:Uncharacterized protein n=1 Tax=Blattamonas nauphoetae TaxID=2049346 RepID=A0ABQ9YBT7_9EUKA|nr:hypothetical protein BLNAU_3837 [Blattamonas nauphoetae]
MMSTNETVSWETIQAQKRKGTKKETSVQLLQSIDREQTGGNHFFEEEGKNGSTTMSERERVRITTKREARMKNPTKRVCWSVGISQTRASEIETKIGRNEE